MPVAIAHRGGALEAPENTREAFAHAVGLGYRYLETDAQITSDGVVVAFHDDSIERVSNRQGAISDWRWDDLQDVEINGSGQLATVEKLLTDYPSHRFNLDAKSNEVALPLLEVIRQTDSLDRVCVGSFSHRRLSRLRANEPRLCTSASPFEVSRFVLRSHGAPVGQIACQALQVPPDFRGIPLLTAKFVDQAHRDGMVVHAWTIDDAHEMHRLLDLGVDGIMTDRPTLLKSVLGGRGDPVPEQP